MPIFPIAIASSVAGFAWMPPWVVTLAVIAVTALGTMRASVKAYDYGHSAHIAEARAPGTILFCLFVYSVVIGLPYLIGVGVRSVVD